MNLPTEVRYRPYADWTNEEKTKIKENVMMNSWITCPMKNGQISFWQF